MVVLYIIAIALFFIILNKFMNKTEDGEYDKDLSLNGVDKREFTSSDLPKDFPDTFVLDGIKYELNSIALYASIIGYEGELPPVLTIPDKIEIMSVELPVCCIESKAFKNSKIRKVILPNLLTDIMNDAFVGCKELETIEVAPENETLKVVDGILYDESVMVLCPAKKDITHLVVPDFCTEIMPFAFHDNTSLVSVEIHKDVECLEDNPFKNCPTLERIDVDEMNANYSSKDGVLYVKPKDETFNKYSLLSAFPCGKKFDGFPEEVTDICDYAFYGNTSLKDLVIPDSVKNIWSGAFMNCPNLEKVELPDSLDYVLDETFMDCVNLKSVKFGSSVEQISCYTFMNCKSLKEIYLPDSLLVIFLEAFKGCDNLEKAYVPEKCEIAENAFPRWTVVIRR